MLTMLEQSFTSEALAQQIAEKRFHQIKDALCCGQGARLGAPTVWPVIDVQIVFLERWRRFSLSGLSGLSRLSGSVHVADVSDLPAAELLLEVTRERIDPDAFDRLSVAMQGVELAPALSIAEVLPVGGLVASTSEAWFLDEGFEQDRPIGVACLPLIGQASAHQGEDARGQVFAVDPRQDEEAGIVHDEVQIALSLIGRPADDLVPRFDLPGARAEADGGDDVAGGAHKVAQLRPG